MEKTKYIIYKEFGILYFTAEDNYNARIRDKNRVTTLEGCKTFEEAANLAFIYLGLEPEDLIDKTEV